MPDNRFLQILPFERIAKKVGVSRLSREGAEELREAVEEIATGIAEHATRVALHAGRKTVTREDIEFVTGKVSHSLPVPQQPKKAEPRQAQVKSS